MTKLCPAPIFKKKIKLYKLMSYLMARKEEITIDHLSTLHAIMSAPAHSKPLSRDALRAFALIQ